MTPLRVPVPKTRVPFVNTPLLRIGPDRFWTSSWNATSGSTGVLVRADGSARIYRFPPPHAGFYSAVATDPDTLWLCGDLSRIVRLTLSSGRWEAFPTGADPGLVFQGMALDPGTGKLLVVAFTGSTTDAVSFDTRACRTVRVHRGVTPQHYLRASFPDGGGVRLAVETPETELLRWDPAGERLHPGEPAPEGAADRWRLLSERGRAALEVGSPPGTEGVRWFTGHGRLVYGARTGADHAEVVCWDQGTGATRTLCRVPDADHFTLALTADGRHLVAVTRYGEFHRFDAATGRPELRTTPDTDAVCTVDCLVRLDERTVLGTPFISQRFWTVDLLSGRGEDRGRAAPGGGQVTRTWHVGGKVYLAAYAGGELTEYAPDRPGRFPDNPRVVAAPPGAMRPVASTRYGSTLIYSSTHQYGRLGCVLAWYDPATGRAGHLDDPLPEQSVQSMHHVPGTATILAGTARHADMSSRDPAAATCRLALLDAASLEVRESVPMPPGADHVTVHGRLDDTGWLCGIGGLPGGYRWFRADPDALATPERFLTMPGGITPEGLLPTDRPGRYVVRTEDRVELWDLAGPRRLRVLHTEPGVYRVVVQDDSVYLVTPGELIVLDHVL
ncbi:PQQ-binding-like beta-propeller repeat protein [Microbispora sp. NPDC046933]|uniref:outer membrane protein assembly factor BamB family protein n=1 Tax=Microbispora sp. NPDC046933 TaxID=3155618 RepID=UPI0033DE4374